MKPGINGEIPAGDEQLPADWECPVCHCSGTGTAFELREGYTEAGEFFPEESTLGCFGCTVMALEPKYQNLYLAKYTERDGEREYNNCQFLNADGYCEAFSLAERELHTYYGEKTERDGRWYLAPEGYPAVKLCSVTKVSNLAQLVHEVGSIN